MDITISLVSQETFEQIVNKNYLTFSPSFKSNSQWPPIGIVFVTKADRAERNHKSMKQMLDCSKTKSNNTTFDKKI